MPFNMYRKYLFGILLFSQAGYAQNSRVVELAQMDVEKRGQEAIVAEQMRAALANQLQGFLLDAPDVLAKRIPNYQQSEFRNVRLGFYSYPLQRRFMWSFIICGEYKFPAEDEFSWNRFAITGGTSMKSEFTWDALMIKAICVSNFEQATWLKRDYSADISHH